MSAGKGSSPRPVDQKKWDRNREKINFKGRSKAVQVEKSSKKTTYHYG